ncbi:putative glycolipid-binding domain-containing protein [Kitasatospora sp. CMC57]|uniref:Glycolipid-binding domain-containing protein n=1 Tax=Kitasatospora sp. CMC57 TaxID=3231513 RepID=A0AB33JVI3_9ACTN
MTVPSWEVTASQGFETAWVELGADRLTARGRVVGTVPEPYWLTYRLETDAGWVTRRLSVTADTAGGTRELDLRRSEDGRWTADGRDLPVLAGALDCDLGLSPLTNTMPVLRHGLHRAGSVEDFLMAWVSVPDLAVRPSRQRYTHLGAGVVRYASGDFASELTFDQDGLVRDYPQLARRLG